MLRNAASRLSVLAAAAAPGLTVEASTSAATSFAAGHLSSLAAGLPKAGASWSVTGALEGQLARRLAHAAASPSAPEGESLPQLVAALRSESGTTAANNTRKAGYTPAVLDSINGSQENMRLKLNKNQVAAAMRAYGRSGLVARPMELLILEDEEAVKMHNPEGGEPAGVKERFRVLPRVVHVDPVRDVIENIILLHAPSDRVVKVDVPVALEGEGSNLTIARGGYVMRMRWTVKMRCTAGDVPPKLPVNVSHLELDDVIHLRDLELPPGCELAEKDPAQPVLKIDGRMRR